MTGGVKTFSELDSFIASGGSKLGCLVDTSILFSASESLDPFNEEAEKVFQILSKNKIPVFTNVNVRTEFIEQHRRVAVPTALIDFFHDVQRSRCRDDPTAYLAPYPIQKKNGERSAIQAQ